MANQQFNCGNMPPRHIINHGFKNGTRFLSFDHKVGKLQPVRKQCLVHLPKRKMRPVTLHFNDLMFILKLSI